MPWKRNLIILIGVQVLALMAMGMFVPFLSLYLEDLGIVDQAEQRWWAGILRGASVFCSALLGVVWGTLSDRFGRRLMVLRALLASAVIVFLMAFATNVYQLLVLRLFQGALGGGVVSASIVLMASLVPRKRTGITIGLIQGAVAGGYCLGPFIGGAVADHFESYRVLFFITSGLMLLASLPVIFLLREPKLNHPPGSEPRLGEAYGAFLRSPGLFRFALALFVVHAGMMMMPAIIPLFIKQTLGVTQNIGKITGAVLLTGTVIVLVAPFWGFMADRFGHLKIVIICVSACTLLLPVHALVPSVTYLVLLRLVLQCFSGGIRPAARALITRIAPNRQLGGLYNAANTSVLLGTAVGPIIGGMCAAAFSDRIAFVIAGAVVFLGLLMCLFLLPMRDALSAHKIPDDSGDLLNPQEAEEVCSR